MKLDRRSTLRLLAAAAAAGSAQAQQPQSTPQQEVDAARQDLKDAALRIGRVKLPQTTEPAFAFRA